MELESERLVREAQLALLAPVTSPPKTKLKGAKAGKSGVKSNTNLPPPPPKNNKKDKKSPDTVVVDVPQQK